MITQARAVSLIFILIAVLTGISVLFLPHCKSKTVRNGDTTSAPQTENIRIVPAPEFNPDSAYAFIEKQVSFGPRIPETPSQTQCAEWLAAKLKSYNGKVYIQDLNLELWNHEMVPCKNITAAFNPDIQKRILLCAHWDTRPWSDRDLSNPRQAFDGADDGGSGVAVLLEIARHLSTDVPNVGVDIVFFDVEDYGPPTWEPESKSQEINGYCLGSQEWASDPHVADYRAYYGILLDMVGAKNATFMQEGVSLQFAPTIQKKVWDIAHALGYGNYFINKKMPGVTDDHYFVNSVNGTPAIDIINLDPVTESGFAKHWHTQQDNMSIIDKNTLKAVGQTVLQVIYSEPSDAI